MGNRHIIKTIASYDVRNSRSKISRRLNAAEFQRKQTNVPESLRKYEARADNKHECSIKSINNEGNGGCSENPSS